MYVKYTNNNLSLSKAVPDGSEGPEQPDGGAGRLINLLTNFKLPDLWSGDDSCSPVAIILFIFIFLFERFSSLTSKRRFKAERHKRATVSAAGWFDSLLEEMKY